MLHSTAAFVTLLISVLPTFLPLLISAQNCGTDYSICTPAGAGSGVLGPIGPNWVNLFDDLIQQINQDAVTDQSVTSINPDGPAKRADVLCCARYTNCLLLDAYKLPFCWDRFTTNVYFADKTEGNLATGQFNLTTYGDIQIDLIYGDWMASNGSHGNIYQDYSTTTTPLDTTTMSMPTPWTSSGVGSAIPASRLGTTAFLSTGISTIPATTEPAVIAPSITIVKTMTGCTECTGMVNTTIAGPTIPGTTRMASTSVFTTGIIGPPISRAQAPAQPPVDAGFLAFFGAAVVEMLSLAVIL